MDIVEKCQKIVGNNTYYFINTEFEIEYQKYIDDLISKVVEMQLAIEKYGCSEQLIGDFIEKDDDGLLLISTFTTLSFEVLEGIITYLVTKNNKKLDKNNYLNISCMNVVGTFSVKLIFKPFSSLPFKRASAMGKA